jgi:hypothetical protein
MKSVLVALIFLTLAAPVFAQDEAALKAFFEGKHVTLKIDMPGSQEGIDVHADASRALDAAEYGNRLKTYGPSIRTGDRAVVTLVKVKKDLIEFQLSGGGFGTFGDDTSTSVYIPYVQKSGREIELEKRVKDEEDRGKRRDLQRELDRLKDERERQNRNIDVERAHLEEIKRARVAMERQQGGSRFNIRYEGSVPRGIHPEEVMAALAAYVDFSPLGGAPLPEAGPAYDLSALKKGMVRSDVERLFGPILQSSERREGVVSVVTEVFGRGDQRITAEFVEDVLVRYAIASK